MKCRAECQKDFFDKAKAEGYEVNGLAFVQNEKDLYISWADKKIESLLKTQKLHLTAIKRFRSATRKSALPTSCKLGTLCEIQRSLYVYRKRLVRNRVRADI